MENEILELPADSAGLLDLGAVLGQIRAFAHIAGRSTAAQAGFLKQLRDEKSYKQLCSDWRQFCPTYLNISGSQADRIIGLLEEFGPGIFDLKQLMNISTETYRIVEPAVKDHAIHHNGEAIELDPTNAQKIAAVVAGLRRQAAVKPPVNPVQNRIANLEKRFFALLDEIDAIWNKGLEDSGLFSGALMRMSDAMSRLVGNRRP